MKPAWSIVLPGHASGCGSQKKMACLRCTSSWQFWRPWIGWIGRRWRAKEPEIGGNRPRYNFIIQKKSMLMSWHFESKVSRSSMKCLTPPTCPPSQPFSIRFYLLIVGFTKDPKVSSFQFEQCQKPLGFQGLSILGGQHTQVWSWGCSQSCNHVFMMLSSLPSWWIPLKPLQICEQLGVHTRCGPERTWKKVAEKHQTWSCGGHNVWRKRSWSGTMGFTNRFKDQAGLKSLGLFFLWWMCFFRGISWNSDPHRH